MTFDVTGLHPIPMRKNRKTDTWRGCYYVLPEDHSVCLAKTCSECREIHAVTAFGIIRGLRFELNNRCQSCQRSHLEEYRNEPASDGNGSANAERQRVARERNNARTDEQVLKDRKKKRPSGDKRCLTCRVVRPLVEYYSDRGLGDGLKRTCRTCDAIADADRRTRAFIAYWEANSIPLRCYLCAGPYEDIEHLIPKSLEGDPGPVNTRPACMKCNRSGGKFDTPLETYIWQANHPTKSRGEILHEIIMSGTWPFALTTPEEFIEASLNYDEQEVS